MLGQKTQKTDILFQSSIFKELQIRVCTMNLNSFFRRIKYNKGSWFKSSFLWSNQFFKCFLDEIQIKANQISYNQIIILLLFSRGILGVQLLKMNQLKNNQTLSSKYISFSFLYSFFNFFSFFLFQQFPCTLR
eukprot:TRINITY_DN902_c0_g1_i3.p1 TRINITY_DN902_c0_g1~~TRINITY_DN902_c0_g1_i3.p1  ORF type:complete len:133 (+),score=12.08 TRINITY_DN902_c0_g1_i3:370-768(+)